MLQHCTIGPIFVLEVEAFHSTLKAHSSISVLSPTLVSNLAIW